ncbi:purine nucleoside [Cyclospora cayetanensis]|uniref:Purine nucleoside n=1 Tax=Cyclospora cayetanensis TaxID=88456 RepID=A0A1D3D172_9EIME|nr:purine nucleoside [Cyclospora cayetanensis]
MDCVEVQPHGQVQPVVLTVGDPKRVDAVLELCDSYEHLSYNREYKSATAEIDGEKITVISHGVGAAGAMICFEELIKLGAKVIIRAGTCGSLKPDKIKTGDIFVPYAMARDPDATELYASKRLPAVSSPRIYQALLRSAASLEIKVLTGIGLSSGLFYGRTTEHLNHLRRWGELTDVVECELQALFLVGLARGIETGGIITVDGSPLEWDKVRLAKSAYTHLFL